MDILQYIVDHSKKESDLDTLKKTLDQNMDKIKSSVQQIIVNALNHLTPEAHTLGLVYLLFAKMTVAKADQAFLLGTERLLQELNPNQAKKCPEKLVAVAHCYMETCRDGQHYNRAIRALGSAIIRFRPTPEHITPLHADYLCVCLKGRNYRAGEKLLTQKIFDLDPSSTAITPRDLLLYYYYGGMVYMGLKQFDRALYMFDMGMQVPSFGVSAIMVEIFKKLVLVSLLVHGKFLGVPKHASHVVHRHMRMYCSKYVDFANAFTTGDADKLLAVASQHTPIFQQDNNLGLIKQCINALKRRNIKKLTDTYMTLSLSDIAKQAKLESVQEAEHELLKMIANGEINAIINQKDGMVAFEEDVQTFNSPAAGTMLENGISRSIQLTNRLKFMDEKIAISERYIARLHGVREEAFGDFGAADAMGRPHQMSPGVGGRSKIARMFDVIHRP